MPPTRTPALAGDLGRQPAGLVWSLHGKKWGQQEVWLGRRTSMVGWLASE